MCSKFNAHVCAVSQRLESKKLRNNRDVKLLQPTTIEADFLLLNPNHRGGDVIAQCGESYHNNLERVKEGKEEIKLAVNWKRAG